MLDLKTIIDEKYYEIRLLDGTELKLERPSQAMVESTMVLQKINQEEAVKALARLFVSILNRNTEGKIFNPEEVANQYSFDIIGYVIQDYFNFWNGDIVDFPQSQQD